MDLNGREIERAFLMKKVYRNIRQIIQPRKQLSDFKLGTIFMFYNQFMKFKTHSKFQSFMIGHESLRSMDLYLIMGRPDRAIHSIDGNSLLPKRLIEPVNCGKNISFFKVSKSDLLAIPRLKIDI